MSKKYKRLNSNNQSQNQQQNTMPFGIQPEEPVIINEEPLINNDDTVTTDAIVANNNDDGVVTDKKDEITNYVIPDHQHLLHLMKCKLNNNKQIPYAHITKQEEANILKNYSLMKFGRVQPLEVLMTSVLKRGNCVG